MQLDYKANFYLIDKPSNYTSQDICTIIKRKYGFNKVGHSGTLDPLATGLLIIATNSYTKLLTYIIQMNKCYEFVAKFGYQSDSGDVDSDLHVTDKRFVIKEHILNENLKKFIGDIEQKPPIYSAVKVKGKRLYKYARENKTVDIPKRKVHIKSLTLNKIINNNEAAFTVSCSKGTYVRSLVQDLGKSIGTNAVVKELRRTKIENISVKGLGDFEAIIANSEYKLEPIAYSNILTMASIQVDEKELKNIGNGNLLDGTKFPNDEECLVIHNDKVIAMYKKFNNSYYKPLKVLI
jgi:tRNA pseudouridine55 synthase